MYWFNVITQTHTIMNDDDMKDTEDDTTESNTATSSFWNIDTILLEMLFSYNKLCIQLQQTVTKWYDTYAIVRYIICGLRTLSGLCSYVLRHMFYTEPIPERDESWVNIVCLCRIPDKTMRPPTTHDHFLDTNLEPYEEQYYIEETYQNYCNDDTEPELAEMYFSQACITASSVLRRESNIVEIVVWSKDTNRNEQVVNVWSSNQSIFPIFEDKIQYSLVKFLHIEYRHPKMGETGIDIQLPKQLMRVGNQLFSPAFLYRWLKYNVKSQFVFDEEYCLYVMDDNVNQHILRYGDYMVLHESRVNIVKNSLLRSLHFALEEEESYKMEVSKTNAHVRPIRNTEPEPEEEKTN